MGWRQRFTPSAQAFWDRLKSTSDQTRLARLIEEHIGSAPDAGDPPGHVQCDEWWVGLYFEKNAAYVDEAGEEVEADVAWVISISDKNPAAATDPGT